MNRLLTIETNLRWPYDTILLFSFMRSFTEDLDGCMSSMLLNRGYSDAIYRIVEFEQIAIVPRYAI